jgi:hypothetical protein
VSGAPSRPRYGILYPIKKTFGKTSISLHPDIALISCATSKFLPSISLYPNIAIQYLTRYCIKTSISYQYRKYRECRNRISYPISKVFIRYRWNIKCPGSIFLERPRYRTRYRIQYLCHYLILSSKAGCKVPCPPSIDRNEDR